MRLQSTIDWRKMKQNRKYSITWYFSKLCFFHTVPGNTKITREIQRENPQSLSPGKRPIVSIAISGMCGRNKAYGKILLREKYQVTE